LELASKLNALSQVWRLQEPALEELPLARIELISDVRVDEVVAMLLHLVKEFGVREVRILEACLLLLGHLAKQVAFDNSTLNVQLIRQ
jgi:hypothetical protein